MKFVYPAGLWALVGVLVVIGVSLLRRKYDEKTVSSTYLWKLAERFSRRNAPAQRLKRALLFALQLLCLVFACLMIARPLLRMPGADVHYVAVIDGSGSMQMAGAQGETRFERALALLERDMQRLPWGSSVSVVVAGDRVQTIAQRLPRDEAKSALSQAHGGYGAGTVEKALELCGGSDVVCLYTDRDYAQTVHVQVQNVCEAGEWNVSVRSLTQAGAANAFTAEVISGGKDAVVAFELVVDGVPLEPAMMDIEVNGEKQGDLNVHCPKDEKVTLKLTARSVYDYAHVRLEAHVNDGLAEDNAYELIVKPEGTTRVLLVSQKPFFLSGALSAFSEVDLQTVETPEAAEGYDLYVFEGCLPEALPEDGAIWLIDPPADVDVAGLELGEELRGVALTPAQSAQARVAALQQDLSLQAAAVVRFREVRSPGSLTPVLLCGKLPALLAGNTQSGCAFIVMPFDLQDSNLPLLPDFIVLMRNLLRDSVPPMLDAQDVVCGETLELRTLPLCEKLYVQLPDLSLRVLEPDEGFTPERPGSYTLMQELPQGREKMLEIFAHMPADEGLVNAPQETETLVVARDTAMREDAPQAQDYDPLCLLAGMVLLLLIVEWGVYHREKY